MSKLSKVRDFYDSGLWTVSMVSNAVVKNWITAEEYAEITGQPYITPETQGTLSDRVQTLEEAVSELEGN